MEHQTVNAYGNEYARGEFGYDWLFHHEFAHEWFGNLMSVSSNSDMWLHEGTGAYMQPVYAQEMIGDAAMNAAMYRSYLGIRNCAALAPREELSENVVYDNDKAGPGGDIYAKGAWVLHSMRYLMGDEPFWRAVRTLLYSTPEPNTLKPPYAPVFRTSDDFLRFASAEAGADLTWFFDVYVRQPGLPELVRETDGADVVLRWKTPGNLAFPMPIPVRIDGVMTRVEAPGGVARIAGGTRRKIEIDPMLSVLRVLPSLKTCEERKEMEKAAAEKAKKSKKG
jgi:aminopeptidase N